MALPRQREPPSRSAGRCRDGARGWSPRRGPACLAVPIPHPARPIAHAEARPKGRARSPDRQRGHQGRARPARDDGARLVPHNRTSARACCLIKARACRPLHPAKFARCSPLGSHLLAALSAKYPGHYFREFSRGWAARPSAAIRGLWPHNIAARQAAGCKTPGKIPILPIVPRMVIGCGRDGRAQGRA